MENTEEVALNGQSIETGNTGHTRQRNKQKQKQTKPQHNVRWTPRFGFRVVNSVCKRCSVRLYHQLFVRGLMSY
jgi:hypothetical protein